jgi:radical S-adenosyl methionine domain-containing protein 2
MLALTLTHALTYYADYEKYQQTEHRGSQTWVEDASRSWDRKGMYRTTEIQHVLMSFSGRSQSFLTSPQINFAGGEPFLNDIMLGELCKYSHELGMAVSIISNGSLIRPYWMTLYGEFVDVLGVSVDSFDPQTNAAIGRGGDANNQHAERVLRVRALCAEHDIIFKMNTVVCSLNWQEDMADHVRKLDPKRWKVFQVLLLKDENSGGPGELRDARPLVISNDQFWSFVNRHRGKGVDDVLIPEPNDVMQNSYLLLDEELRFLDCSNGGKIPSKSILEVGVEAALMQAGFDDDAFMKRGGVYEWSRARTTSSTSAK